MASIRGKDTRPEMIVRRVLHKAGLRYVLNDKRLPGKPDIVLPKHRLCVFVHGCFWHRHEDCRLTVTPSTRRDFWLRKFATNVERDKLNIAALAALGWRIMVIWECGLKHRDAMDRLVRLPDEVRTSTAMFSEWF